MSKKAVIILSGGLDSTTCMGIAKNEGYACYPITFDYGQRHKIEIECAKKVAKYYEVDEHKIVSLSFMQEIGGSALTDSSIDVPVYKDSADSIPVTYVPARNLIFLSLASAYAEVIGADAIYIGVSAVDYSGYPDCRPEFLQSMTQTIQLATKIGVTDGKLQIVAPLTHLTKADTIRLGLQLHVPYELTTSCYNGNQEACGVCDSCQLRLKGFQEAGAADPVPVARR
jgi:7-cyano-7-deazaguanine synthase